MRRIRNGMLNFSLGCIPCILMTRGGRSIYSQPFACANLLGGPSRSAHQYVQMPYEILMTALGSMSRKQGLLLVESVFISIANGLSSVNDRLGRV